jgi:methyl-accepting chemotaxis protein
MLQNLKIKSKILIAIILLSVISLSGLAYIGSEFLAADKTHVHFLEHESIAAVLTARSSAATTSMVLDLNRAYRLKPGSPEYLKAIKDHDSTLERGRNRLNKVIELVPSQAAAVGERLKSIDELEALDRKVIAALDAGDQKAADAALADLDKKFDVVLPTLIAANDAIAKQLDDGKNGLSASIRWTITVALTVIGLLVLATIGFAMFVIQVGITGPMARLRAQMMALANGDTAVAISGVERKDEIGQMAATVAVFRTNAIDRQRLERDAESGRALSEAERAEREARRASEAGELQRAVESLGQGLGSLASGDLAFRIETPFVDHLDGLRRDFNNSVETLNETLSAVGSNAQGISAGTNEIRSSADDLSKRTEQQAASVEQTAAALEELTTTVKDAAKRASEASQLVARTRTGAEKSGQVVRDAIQAMHQIEQSSNEIGNIIGVIDDIAFQTNLLALNAGVEAARAGEAGKGFAVVAQEVRELAQRSANAAKEIKALITTSGQQVQAGVNLVGETGKALDVIVTEVQEINSHVHAIAESTREQSLGLSEINSAVNTMDQGTQQNAAMVEETTAASHSLAQEAAALTSLLAQFKLAGNAGRRAGFAAPRPAAAPAPRKQAIRPATEATRPAASPARALGNKIAAAFNAKPAAAAGGGDWEEF